MGYIIVAIAQFSVVYKGDNGFEVNTAFMYFIIYLALLLTGPGKYSMDAKLSK